MAYDRMTSLSRSNSRTIQNVIKKRMQLKATVQHLKRIFNLHIRENIDLATNASDIVRNTICNRCLEDSPDRCESMKDKSNRYYCRFLSLHSEIQAYVRLYLPRKTSKNARYKRENIAIRLENLIETEPGIRRSRIKELFKGRWETTLDVLENDLVFQKRVNLDKKKENGKIVFTYTIASSASVPVNDYTTCEKDKIGTEI